MGCRGKAQRRVNASIRHMHRGHGAYFNPTCTLRAPFIWHTCDSPFYLCKASTNRMYHPNKPNNPSILTKRTTQTQCIRLE